jgi:hypothetical protein
MGRRSGFRSGLLGVLVGALLVMGLPVVASVGDAILLGMTNTGNAETRIRGSEPGPLVRIDNNNANGQAVRFQVESGNSPFTVDSPKKVKYLNADRVDGKSASAFLLKSQYDADKNGVVDSAEVKIRYRNQNFGLDMAPGSATVLCVTSSLTLTGTTTVVGSGGLSLHPIGASGSPIAGLIVYTKDDGSNWTYMGGGAEDSPPGGVGDAAVPVDGGKNLGAGTYEFAILPFGSNHQTGDDYTGYCELTVTAYTGQGTSTDVVISSAGLAEGDTRPGN